MAETRRMCPNCRAFITSNDRVCPYCEAQIGARAIDRRNAADAMAGLIDGDRFVTQLILIINIGLYVATLTAGSDGRNFELSPTFDALRHFGGKDGFGIRYGMEYWRFITAGFLHGGVLHILMNSWVLWDLGPRVDATFGTYRYVVIYILSTITGFAASYYWAPGILSIGASAGISGLIGAMVGLGTKEKNSFVGQERGRYIQWMVMIVVMGFMISGIDNAAHIGGFAGGFVVAYLAGSKGSPGEGIWKSLAGVCLAMTAFSFYKMVENLLKF